MVLIRPLLRANDNRRHNVHVVVFFIFLVSNIGGALTPIGDPPLFLGFLRGVSFGWTLTHLWPETLFACAVLLGLFVGIAISGQTFYSFVLENLRYFAAIKAMGAGMGVIARMLLVQACTAGLIGFGLGAGMAQAIGRVMIEKGMPPFVMFPQILWATFALVLGISLVSTVIGIVKVSRVDAATVFRG